MICYRRDALRASENNIPCGHTRCPYKENEKNGNVLNQDASQLEYMVFLRERN